MRSRAGTFADRGAGVVLVLATLALLAPNAACAESTGVVPDAARMTALREEVARAPVLIVRGDFGLREFHRAWLDSSGVRSPSHERRPRPALFVSSDAPAPAAPAAIPWSQISTMQTQRPKKLQGAIAGLLVGIAVGVTLSMNYESKYTEDWTGVGLLLGPPFVGLAGGTILGSLSGTKVIYRAPTQENH